MDNKNSKASSNFFNNQTYLPATLFERPPSADYLEEWTNVLRKQEVIDYEPGALSVVVFRIGQEWLALKTIIFKEIIHRRVIHRIPHRSGKILKGLVNLDGELQLCIALNELFEIGMDPFSLSPKFSYQKNRMIAIKKDQDLWVFAVDEIEGIHAWEESRIENIPVNVAKSTINYLKGIMNTDQKSIALIDEELLFYSLRRSFL